jgi:hypothetical protein
MILIRLAGFYTDMMQLTIIRICIYDLRQANSSAALGI